MQIASRLLILLALVVGCGVAVHAAEPETPSSSSSTTTTTTTTAAATQPTTLPTQPRQRGAVHGRRRKDRHHRRVCGRTFVAAAGDQAVAGQEAQPRLA